jgi:hypothetical protein
MKCGYCNKEMIKGQFTVPEIGFHWLQVIEKSGEVQYIRPGMRIKNQYHGRFTVLKLDGYYCESCKKILIDSELEEIND